MGYSEDPSMVRVDVYKVGGKWSQTLAVKWKTYHGDTLKGGLLIHDAFREALENDSHCSKLLKQDYYIFSCVKPYHEFEHPIMILPSVLSDAAESTM